jgi:alpha-L-fucosidase
LCDCRKVGANLLLNIGPTAQGGIEPIQEEYLKLMGRWNSVYGEAIYEGKPYSVSENGRDFLCRFLMDKKWHPQN